VTALERVECEFSADGTSFVLVRPPHLDEGGFEWITQEEADRRLAAVRA
jgi:hypothetical protein